MAKKIHTTYIVHLTSTGNHGADQDYYYRTEQEAKNQAAELRRWFEGIPSQRIEITSHQWSN